MADMADEDYEVRERAVFDTTLNGTKLSKEKGPLSQVDIAEAVAAGVVAAEGAMRRSDGWKK